MSKEKNTMEPAAGKNALPLGLRQNNPLNIRKSGANKWQGEANGHPEYKFCEFTDIVWGYRAALKTICCTYRKRGWTQLSQVISKWAPRSENNTSLYFAYVLARIIRKLDLYKVKDFTLPEPTMENADVYICLVHAMAVVENGKEFEDLIADGEIRMAYEMLFQR